MLLDLRGSIPSVVQITPGKCPDVAALDHLVLEAGAIYIMDRGYVDFERLHRFCVSERPNAATEERLKSGHCR